MNPCARLLAFGVSLFLAGCSDSRPRSSDPEAPRVPRAIRGLIDDAVKDGFSGVILVASEGEQLTVEAHGLADRARAEPNRPETAFDVGSILKSLTATAIFRLTEEGALTLETPLGELLPDVPDDKARVTVSQIVQHRAGFDEYHDTLGDFEPMTRLEARARILARPLLFPPGADEAYSNSGYTLLADIIETVSGEPYVDFVRRELLAPADMTSTGFYSERLWTQVDTAVGYDASSFGDNDPATWPYTWALVGNGGLVTTASDLDRFVTALFGGRVVTPQTLDVMRDVYFAAGQAEVGGTRLYAEAGAGDFGLGGVAVFAPELRTRVIVVSNAYDALDIESFAAELALQLIDPP